MVPRSTSVDPEASIETNVGNILPSTFPLSVNSQISQIVIPIVIVLERALAVILAKVLFRCVLGTRTHGSHTALITHAHIPHTPRIVTKPSFRCFSSSYSCEMKIATLQLAPKLGDLQGNIARANGLLKSNKLVSAEAPPDILVLPEMALTGMTFHRLRYEG